MFWIVKTAVACQNVKHSHDMHELLMCLNDDGEQWINGVPYSFKAGRIFYLASGTYHGITSSKERPAKLLFVCFDKLHFLSNEWFPIQQMLVELEKNQLFASGLEQDYLNHNLEIINQIIDEKEQHHSFSHERINLLFTDILIRFYRSFEAQLAGLQKTGNEKLKKLCQQITNDPQFDMSFNDAAKYVSLNRLHFSQHFKTYTGMTYVEYIQWSKLKHAVRFLTTSDKGISEVAELSGFNNLGYFHRVFKKYIGMTPLSLKKYVKDNGAFPKILTISRVEKREILKTR